MVPAGGRYIYYASRTDTFRIWALADFHLGNIGCHKALLKKHIAEIAADPFSYWVGIGDYGEYITSDDKRANAEMRDKEVLPEESLGSVGMTLSTYIRDLLQPIAHKCLGMGYGNHEFYYMNTKDQQRLHSWLCTELKVADLGYSFLMNVCFIRKNVPSKLGQVWMSPDIGKGAAVSAFRLYGHHGAGGASTRGGKTRRLEKFMHDNPYAHAYFIGHVHDQQVLKIPGLDGDRSCEHLVARDRLGMITGSYLRTYMQGTQAGYGERAAYGIAPLGATIFEFTPDTRESSARVYAQLGDII